MTTHLTRRGILKALGIGTLALAAEPILEPARKLWFVSSNAPVGSRIERAEGYQIGDSIDRWSATSFAECSCSQADLDALRVAARRAEFVFTEAERSAILVALQDDYRARNRAAHRWSPSEEYEADHPNNNAGTLVLAG